MIDNALIILGFIIILLVIVAVVLYCENLGKVKNPDSSYWFARSDAGGHEVFNSGGNYLYQEIVPPISTGACDSDGKCTTDAGCFNGQCIPYTNSEIYNSPCCSVEKMQAACEAWITSQPSATVQNLLQGLCQKYPDLCSVLNSNNLQAIKTTLCQLYMSICGGPLSSMIPSKYDHCYLVPNAIPSDPDIVTSLKELFFNTPYLYSKIITKIKVSNLKDGSRGWGFWNTNVDPMAMAWFIQQDGICPPGLGKECPEGPYELNGFYAMITDPVKGTYSMQKLPDLDEGWHTYEIDWQPTYINFIVDGNVVHKETKVIPSTRMAYHCWVDNAIFAPWHVVQNMSAPRSQTTAWIEIYK